MRLKEIKPGMVVHCKTQEEANILCDTICNTIVEKSKWKGYWVNYYESTCYKISNAGFYSYGTIASYKDSNITEFSDLILPELTAEEVWNGLGDVEDDEIYEYFQQPCLFATRDELILRADWKDLVAIVEKHIADHEKKEPEIDTVDICRIIEIQPDGRKRCVHEIDLNPDGDMLFKEQIEEILKRYCMEHEGEFIAVHETVFRVKK